MSTPPDEPEQPAPEPAPGPPPQPPAEEKTTEPAPKSHALRNVALIVAGLFVAIVAGFLIGRSGDEPEATGQVSATQAATSPSPAPPSPAAPSPAPSPKPSPPPAASPSSTPASIVLVDIQGTGPAISGPFDAPSEWKLTYDYECPGTVEPRIEIDLNQGDQGIKTLITDARLSGGATVLVDVGGSNLHLQIVSECSWHVTAKT